MTKTNAARILDAASVRYELREYNVDEEHLAAPQVAEAIGMPPEQVFIPDRATFETVATRSL